MERENNTFVYQKNIDNIKEFFETDEYKHLKKLMIEEKNNPIIVFKYKQYIESNKWLHIIKHLINEGILESKNKKIYIDPDGADKNLYKKILSILNKEKELYIINPKNNTRLQSNGFEFSLDCIIGWKALIDNCYNECRINNDFTEFERNFIDKYEKIRNPQNTGHLIWPIHDNSTINTERYKKFNDRIDYTLLDIKNYYEPNFNRENLKLKNVYFTKNGHKRETAKWLDTFKNFKNFIVQMNLDRWCDEDYKLYNLDSENKEDTIDEYLCDEDSYNAQKEYPITTLYINNLIDKIEEK